MSIFSVSGIWNSVKREAVVLDPCESGVALEFTISEINGKVSPALGPTGTVYLIVPLILGSLSSVYLSFLNSVPINIPTGPAGNS